MRPAYGGACQSPLPILLDNPKPTRATRRGEGGERLLSVYVQRSFQVKYSVTFEAQGYPWSVLARRRACVKGL